MLEWIVMSFVTRVPEFAKSKASMPPLLNRDRVSSKKAKTLAKLRRLIERIERRPLQLPSSDGASNDASTGATQGHASAWCLGVEKVDGRFGAHGLATAAVHEIKPSHSAAAENWAGASMAAMGFAFALSARHGKRHETCKTGMPIALCQPTAMVRELGRVYPWGLPSYGLEPSDLLLIEPRRAEDVLWAAEECLRSQAVRALIMRIDDVDLTSARRLSLAAAAYDTPCLLITGAHTPVTAATATRWSVGPSPCTADPFDDQSPGARSFNVVLERCRAQPSAVQPNAFVLEWCDETLCFRLAAGLCHRAPAPEMAQAELIRGPFGAVGSDRRRSERAA